MENSNLNSFQQEALYQVLVSAATVEEQFKLFQMLKPELYQEGEKWYVTYGKRDSKNAISGCGDTPVKAISQWQNAWYKSLKKEL